jgi:hypothetical protein
MLDMTEQPTLEIMDFFGKPKQVTRDQFIKTWIDHAAQLRELMPVNDFLDTVRKKAGERFDECLARENKK